MKKVMDYQVKGDNSNALFSLKLHRGEGMTLIAMNWKNGKPPKDFVGFAIEYKEPNGQKFYVLKNRLSFPETIKKKDANKLSTMLSPIQKFRWVHFPRNADIKGKFTYRVTPVFMNTLGELSYGEQQVAKIELLSETYAGKMNVSFTRGYVSSQAFVDKYESFGSFSTLIPASADDGLTFKASHPKTKEALQWMGFEARNVILQTLDKAIEDKSASVYVVAYELCEPEMVSRLKKLGKRLQIIIDDSGKHKPVHSAESQAEIILKKSAGAKNVIRQNLGGLQHNKTIIVKSKKENAVICGSTNFSWRGFYVQSNNAVLIRGAKAVSVFLEAFTNYWNNNKASDFGVTTSTGWKDISNESIKMSVTFSPHNKTNGVLQSIAKDIEERTTSSLFFSLAFLYQTPGAMQDALNKLIKDDKTFIYGISDKKTGGIDVQKQDGNVILVHPKELSKSTTPEPFKSEPKSGKGVRMHHKFIVVDFDKPTARVYLGSYNFSVAADTKNGENLLLIRDRKVATAYMIEALRMIDQYHFRIAQSEAKTKKEKLELALPPKSSSEKPWWNKYYDNTVYKNDRELFS